MGLYENMAAEPVSRLNLREPVTAKANDSVRTAIENMRERNLGCVIVVDNDKPAGLYTEAMLRSELAHDGTRILDEPLSEHMATTVPWVRLSDTIDMAIDAMAEKNTRFIAVVDDDDRLSALSGQKGLMEYVAEHYPDEILRRDVTSESHDADREGA